jgi:lysophospholipase L1-like esterase
MTAPNGTPGDGALTSSQPRPDPAKRASLSSRVGLAITAFVATVAVVEIALRLVAPVPYSSDLRWISDGHVKARLDPEQHAVNQHGNHVQINSLGFRGAEPSPDPPPGTVRLVALGGSATFCYDVTDDAHTWPARLEERLAQALGGPIEVINLGLPGYDAANSKVNYLFTARALHPHVVLVYHTWNDMKLLRSVDASAMLPRDALSGRRGASTNVSVLGRLVWDAQLSQRIRLLYLGLRDGAWENYYVSLEGTGSDAEAPIGDRGWRWFRQNFVDLVRFARDDGALPVLISQATLVHPDVLADEARRATIHNELLGMTLPRLVQSWPQANRILREVAESEGAVFVDGYDAVPGDLEHLRDHVHPTDRGADRLAQTIAAELLNDGRFRTLVSRIREP